MNLRIHDLAAQLKSWGYNGPDFRDYLPRWARTRQWYFHTGKPVTLPAKSWSNATADEILADLRAFGYATSLDDDYET